MNVNIPIAKTTFTEQEFQNIHKPLLSGWVVQGPFVREFEEKWSKFTSAKHSIAVSNCTTALHLSLAALGITIGDEVIVPSFTWVATANAVESLGAKPVFCDIDPVSYNIDPDRIEKLITDKTKAIIPVHLFGLSADMDAVIVIAKKHDLLIIEDAACGFASRYHDRHVGTMGDTGCFSFHPRKAITTGEGGMITTDNDKLAEKLRAMRDHGATMSDHQRHLGSRPYLLPEFPYLGFNYRMTDIQASIGSTQMDRAEQIHIARQSLASRYDEALADISWLRTPLTLEDSIHGYQAYVCMFNPDMVSLQNVSLVNAQRNEFMDYLQKNGVATRPGTHAVHMLEYYSKKYGIRHEDFPNGYIADHCTITFPLFPGMTEEEYSYIIQLIKDYTF
ncbi:DegT/DnrJ/EryC1/StrS family aminotransferase [bacterium]|nr:DegT/DnrJ/EryC1/StrS family aminotransferase [bacterium]